MNVCIRPVLSCKKLAAAHCGETFVFQQYNNPNEVLDLSSAGKLLHRMLHQQPSDNKRLNVIELDSGAIVTRDQNREIFQLLVTDCIGESVRDRVRIDELKPGTPFTWTHLKFGYQSLSILRIRALAEHEGDQASYYDWHENTTKRLDGDVLVWPFHGQLVVEQYSQKA